MIDTISLLWLGLMMIFIITEIVSFNLITIWFAFGSLLAFSSSLFSPNTTLQVTLFFVGSIITLLAIRPFCKRFTHTSIDTSVSRLIGDHAIVIIEIKPLESVGQVKVQGQVWSAKSKDDDVILVGTRVKILDVEGVKLLVEPIREGVI